MDQEVPFGDGVVTGHGEINGRKVFVFSQVHFIDLFLFIYMSIGCKQYTGSFNYYICVVI